MSESEGLLPPEIRADIEEAVAEAFDVEDLRSELETLPDGPRAIPLDQDEVDLIIMWVRHSRDRDWPSMWQGSDTFGPFIDGCIVAAIQAVDLAHGRDPTARDLSPYQSEALKAWARQSRYESR